MCHSWCQPTILPSFLPLFLAREKEREERVKGELVLEKEEGIDA